MELDVFFAGTAGSVPTARRGLPAALVRRGGERLLFDCGEGTQRQLVRSIGLPDVAAIFITHYHLDHWLGLPGMLKTFDLRGREVPLAIYGPPGLEGVMRVLRSLVGRLRYELTVRELRPNERVPGDGYDVAPFEVDHRVAAYGYALWEDARPGEFDPAAAQRLGVTPGPDFGRLQRGESVDGVDPRDVLGPPRPGRKLVISGDCAPSDSLRLAAHEADLLVHEATFIGEEAARARETAHTTAAQAAQIALDAGVRMLALTHLSTRYGGREVRDEARAVFAKTVVPHDFDAVEIPFPERGEPRLVRWEDAGVRT